MKIANPKVISALFAILLTNLTAFGAGYSGSSFGALLLPASRPRLMALAAPLVARLTPVGRPPLMLATSPENFNEVRTLLEPAPIGRVLLLETKNPKDKLSAWDKMDRFVLSDDDGEAAVAWTRLYWESMDSAVFAPMAEPASLITAASLAANLGVPLLPDSLLIGEKDLAEFKKRGLAKAVWVISATAPPAPALLPIAVRRISPAEASSELGRLLGGNCIPCVALYREPDLTGMSFGSSWIVPWYSLARKALPLALGSPRSTLAEKAVAELVTSGIRPRNLLFVGDNTALSSRRTEIPGTKEKGYKFNVEPCAGLPLQGAAMPYGVGRLPLRSLEQCSLAVARGLVREIFWSGAGNARRALVVANGKGSKLPSLYLCEGISRLSAAEMKNAGFRVDEVYGSSPQKGLEAGLKASADLILYEGHVEYQNIIPDPDRKEYDLPEEADGEEEWGETPTVNEPVILGVSGNIRVGNPENSRSILEQIGKGPREPFERCPLLILQACKTLQGEVPHLAFENGAAGVVGSVSRIHSASGSAAVKCLVDSLIYRGATVGEALRDAKNFFLCIQKLKLERGHRELKQGLRVALSLGYWGDPEFRPFPQQGTPPLRPLVQARWQSGELQVSTPRKKLSSIQTPGYRIRQFPGSQSAGLVMRAVSSDRPRRLAPIHYFVQPWPTELAGKAGRRDLAVEAKGRFSTCLSDPNGRFLCVLSLPPREHSNDNYLLKIR
ncbi:MAG: hypothetical protein HQL31_00835 [Planctomycetes bacterium]|nr:hypothetical protein [Planctomycetota bacterium]